MEPYTSGDAHNNGDADDISNPGAYHSAMIPANLDFAEEASAVVRLRGIPFSATADDIRAFATGYRIDDPDGVLVMTHGERRGEAFVRLTDAYEAERFQTERHRHNIGERYVEIYAAYPEDMVEALREEEASGSLTKNPIVRLRGLPFAATDDDVALFFSQVADKMVNLRFVEDVCGRRTGDAFLELADEDAVTIAMTKHLLLMGTRYVEVTRTTASDREAVLHVASRRGRGGVPASQLAFPNGRGGGMMPPHFPGVPPFPMFPPFMPPPKLPLAAGANGQITVQIGKEAADAAAAAQAANAAAAVMMRAAMFGMAPPFGMVPPNGSGSRHGTPPVALGTGAGSSSNGTTHPGGIAPPSPLMPPTPPRAQSRYIVRVRGLPFSASEATVAEFFHDVQIQPQGVHMVYNAQDRPTGEAFVEVESEEDIVRALDHNGGALGHRYIEVFKSGPGDMLRLGGGPPAGAGGGAGAMDGFAAAMGMGMGMGMLPPSMMMMPPYGYPPYGGGAGGYGGPQRGGAFRGQQ